MDNHCGYDKDDGKPCRRPAGWGTESQMGHCKDHAEEYRVPRKLDEETASTLRGAARAGAKIKDCAAVAGIARSTLWDWLNTGEEHASNDLDTPLAEFYRTFQRARGAGAVELLRDSSSEFILERSYGYVKTEKREVEHSGEGGGPIMVIERGSDSE